MLPLHLPLNLTVKARLSGVRIGIAHMIGMRLRGTDSKTIIKALIKARKANLSKIEVSELDAHYLFGGNVHDVINALILAKNVGLSLSFNQAAAIDLSGKNILAGVKDAIDPHVISIPFIEAECQDKIILKIKADITIRTHLNKLIGGAGVETIISRVSEAIIATVGKLESYKTALANPNSFREGVPNYGLIAAGTAYEVLSIDITDIAVKDELEDGMKSILFPLPKELRHAVKQYLLFFKEFVEKTKGKEIFFEVKDSTEGLVIVIREESEVPKESIFNWLNEYVNFFQTESSNWVIRTEVQLDAKDSDLLRAKLENEVAHLKNQIRIAEMENHYLKKEVTRLEKYMGRHEQVNFNQGNTISHLVGLLEKSIVAKSEINITNQLEGIKDFRKAVFYGNTSFSEISIKDITRVHEEDLRNLLDHGLDDPYSPITKAEYNELIEILGEIMATEEPEKEVKESRLKKFFGWVLQRGEKIFEKTAADYVSDMIN